MNASLPERAAHLDRLFDLVAEVDFAEQLGRAELLIDRRRDELLRERRASARCARAERPAPEERPTRRGDR